MAAPKKTVRTTLILPEPVDQNVKAYSALKGVSKNAAFVQLLVNGLSSAGFQPSKTPKVRISY